MTAYMMDTTQKQSAVTSLGIHALVLILLFGLVSQRTAVIQLDRVLALHKPLLAPYASKPGGGGQHAVTPASKGRIPPRSTRQFIMPINLAPKLPMVVGMELPPDAVLSDVKIVNFGDPNGLNTLLSGGTGGPSGIGDGHGKTLGPADGKGGAGPAGVFTGGPGLTMPVLIKKVEPEFSEEARKAKASGRVLVYAEIGLDGKPHNLRVMRSFGLGLDEEALKAVSQWLFRPGTKDGKPVVVGAQIDVAFHLL